MNARRRTLLQAAAGSALIPDLCFGQEPNQYSDKSEADRWMQEWMGLTKAAYGALHVLRFSDGLYALTRSIGWAPNSAQSELKPVAVNKGFVTDFASIPRIFWSLLPKDGRYTYAAVIHDFLYWNQSTTREVADQIFDEAMLDFKVSSVERGAIYRAVRLGGGFAWAENKRLRELGERRVVKKLPNDPTVSWEVWKKNEENF